MIVKMKKYAFMVFHREYDQFLSTLRDLGVVHIKETKSIADNAELQEMIAERKRVSAAIRSFKRLNEGKKDLAFSPAVELSKEDGLQLVGQIEELQDKRAQLQAQRQSLHKEIEYMDLWGDFSYTSIKQLKKVGYNVTFYTCPTAKFEPKWVDEYNAVLINNFQSVTYFITITKEGTLIDIDAERPKMPDMGLAKLQARNEQLKEDMQAVDTQLQEMAVSQFNTLLELDKHLSNEFHLMNAIVQTDRQAEDRLMFLEGWTTEDNTEVLEKELDKQGYFFQEVEKEEGEKTPVKLKNNSFAKLYEPITKLYSLPNYLELDPTPLFAPFFMLFFGLCFGDGGYGLIILLLCTFLKTKVSADYKPFLSLFQWLGGMTIVVGTLTGSFFGVALVDVPAFQSVKKYFLSSDNLMTLSIVIGIFHVILGKAVAAYKTKVQRGLKHSIAPFAWVFVLTFSSIGLGLPMLNVHLPQIVIYACLGIAAVGFLVALFYNTPGKNILLNFGSGLWNTYNMASGVLGDVLSYIRLFAIGLTGSILGSVFNSLAVSMTESLPVVAKVIVMLLILLVGHSLNFALCMISSLVHPLRLVFVEYFKNSEYEGGGKEYLPFKKA
ncbi:V/A-type H+-transporting ATPase subunit I [Parabacteroides sp. PF5-5]|uniref:V-type ATP synthase subunit I n=1 Tax=unclassified Parabacteroides TaxID=2649774 RepID=UPI002476507C|nr:MULTISPECIES: V-type ATPase 116kDa subunit family protein [unclassified Parabacteroides]MDH6304720.1 V/A-type H+-transporting ATPase subunit I [Parabacteroides sp. PH5-39]MDH6315665.1 V/A-type H+-transporting ATPase subunit I [Parabacteroides sp. PF5-13]MDH6319326.1 V/A-type H+-transporting ATPase subunit I [Parabacteroides sp. PH5-13]MDH6323057.1 V/A-type H+-transporting ATPase subunit I [Parabacteroides sp. PH5-8]MDH6326858.1 V/A-type H+-transporting ATPase subunit I [Parabacteroides sp. 